MAPADEAVASTVYETYRVETPDGVIYGEVMRPAASAKVPVILTYSPYNHLREPELADGGAGEDLLLARDGVADYFVPRGYARAVFSVVGTHSSSGCFDYGGPRSRRTGYAVVEHLARQSWSNGRVGMIGLSYDGSSAVDVAVAAPPHLFAIIAQAPVTRRYDHQYVHGVRTLSPEPMYDDALGLAGGSGPDGWAGHVQLCDRVRNTQESGTTDPIYGKYWAARDSRSLAGNIRAAVMLEHGWRDRVVWTQHSTKLFQLLPAGIPKRMVLGQWGHDDSAYSTAQAERLAWFDTWLKGVDRGVQRQAAVLSVDTSPTWPPPGTREITVPLGTGTKTWTDVDRTLNENVWAADPDGDHPGFVSLHVQLAGNVRVVGGTLDLTVTSSQPETHIAAFLYAPGRWPNEVLITRGYLNTRNRNGLDRSDAVVPGKPYAVSVPLSDTDVPVPDGRRLTLVLASSNQTEVLSDDAPPATNTIDLSKSRLRLLVVPD